MILRRSIRAARRQAGAIPAFNASAYGTVQYWFDPSAAYVTLAGSDVTAWADRASTPHNLAPIGAAATRPTYTAANSNFNSKPTINFASASGEGLISAAWTPVAGSVVMVLRWTAVETSVILSYDASGAGEFYQNGAATNIHYQGAVGSDIGSPPMFATACTSANIWILDDNGASSNIYQNSTTATVGPGNTGAPVRTLLCLGNRGDGALPSNSEIAYVVGYAGVLSASSRGAVLRALGRIFGIAVTT